MASPSRPSSAVAGGPSIPSSPRPSGSRSSLRPAAQPPRSIHEEPQSVEQGQEPHSTHDGLQPPSLAPVFALISSSTPPATRQNISHPTVHYIFADDDPELWTEALAQHHRAGGADDAEVSERAIVLDMVPADNELGFAVASASSLSPDWAVTSAELSRMGGLAAAHGDGPGALMLRIEGVSAEVSEGPSPEGELQSSGASGGKEKKMEEYASLVAEFERRMGVLKKVVDKGGERERAETGGV
ncbi:hypothetical protein OQA88_1381 [Cercophora sp. LCS_1]